MSFDAIEKYNTRLLIPKETAVACSQRVRTKHGPGVHGPPTLDRVHGPLSWTGSMDPLTWTGSHSVLSIPIPKSLAFWASPVGDAQNADPVDFAHR